MLVGVLLFGCVVCCVLFAMCCDVVLLWLGVLYWLLFAGLVIRCLLFVALLFVDLLIVVCCLLFSRTVGLLIAVGCNVLFVC